MSNEGDTLPGKDTITVTRPLENGTDLSEVWVLRVWSNNTDAEPVLRCHISKPNDQGKFGVPHSDHCVTGLCEFSEAPEIVQKSFANKLKEFGNLGESLE